MQEKDKKYLQELLEHSEKGSSRTTLKKLAKDMISLKEFNTILQHKFDNDRFNSSEVISEIVSRWTSFKGSEANFNNFEKISRAHGLNAEAGE